MAHDVLQQLPLNQGVMGAGKFCLMYVPTSQHGGCANGPGHQQIVESLI